MTIFDSACLALARDKKFRTWDLAMSKWKQINLGAIIAVLTTFSLCSKSMAANISVVKGTEGAADVIIIEGPIVAEDEKTFKQIALNSEFATVVLDSRGGKIRPAIAIGKTIRIKEFSTAVIGADCLSVGAG
jgi:hypothetical protein